MTTPLANRKTVRFELAPSTLAWVIGAAAGIWLISKLWIVVLILVVSLVFVGTFNPIIVALEARGLRRRHALILLLLTLILGAALMLFLTVPALIEQFTAIIRDLPNQREKMIAALARHNLTAPLGSALSTVGLDRNFARLQTYLIGYSSHVASAVASAITTFVLAFYFLADGQRTQGALYAVVPRRYHMRLARIIHNLETIVGGYMRGQLITSVSIGVFAFLLLTACGVRNAVSLALFAALMDVLPFVGWTLATAPAVLTALGNGQTTALIVLAGMFVYLQFESKILVPRIYGQVLRLSPASVLLALIAGGTLLGIMGALLALPIAAGLQMIVKELGVDMPGDDSDDTSARALDQNTEAAYEVMSAGSSPHEAGQIASDLAHDIRAADAWVEADRARKRAE